MRTITKFIVHCSDTPNDRDVTIEDIKDWHVNGNGWSDIGYHYVIDRDGRIHSGRPVRTAGAHCYGHNSDSIGVCLVGRDQFETWQFDALRKLYASLLGIFKEMKPYGHRDFTDTKSCPNFEVKEVLK